MKNRIVKKVLRIIFLVFTGHRTKRIKRYIE